MSSASLSPADTVSVPSAGEWTLRVALRDEAGNSDPASAALIEPLRFDPNPPTGEFLPVEPTDPSRIRLHARDDLSGVQRVEIELRRAGEGTWRSVSTQSDGPGEYSAVPDDTQLPAGVYDVRARVIDVAGNPSTVTDLRDGAAARIALPARAGSTLLAGRPTKVLVKPSRGGKPRHKKVLVDRATVKYGAGVSLEGKLTDGAGKPGPDESVEVYERIDAPGHDWRYLATVRTTSDGSFAFRATAGPSRTIRFSSVGTPLSRPSSHEVELDVRAAVTIRPDRRRVRNGHAVIFRGRLRGAPIPDAGKLLALQALTSRGWRTFATPRARAGDGRWTSRYRFTATTMRLTYAFRVLVPAESGYPYVEGTSPTTRVVVTP